MPKAESTQSATTQSADTKTITSTLDATAVRPRLGTIVNVVVPEGMHLINGETGTYFKPGVPTSQTVTITTLRRLDDGDLVLA